MSEKKGAEEYKQKGNQLFREKKYEEAIESYTKAIELEENAIFYSNRALCHIHLENYGAALEDSNKSIELDPNYVKGYYRRGVTNIQLFKLKEALKDLRFVLKSNRKEKIVRQRVKHCISEIKRIQFLKAIESEETIPTSEKIKMNEMFVDSSYDGLKFDHHQSGSITLNWVLDMIDRFKQQKKIPKPYVYYVLLEFLKLMKKEESLYDVTLEEKDRITVCGDTHGQFYDTMNIFTLNGYPSKENPYIFNGDFVDRGSFSFENVFTLFAFKVMNPECIYFTRGNHESIQLNSVYGFEKEVKVKYGEDIFDFFQEVFNTLPLCALINKKILILHGGIGFEQQGITLEDIRKINRFRQIPDSGLMSDILWSDPQKLPGTKPSKRGVSRQFGPDITKAFMENNGLDYVIRSHELKQNGYEEECDGKLITVFSCPNYCDQARNKGAYIHFNGKDLKPVFNTFTEVPHPKVQSYQNTWM